MTFFASFLHLNDTFTFSFPYLLLLIRTKDYLPCVRYTFLGLVIVLS